MTPQSADRLSPPVMMTRRLGVPQFQSIQALRAVAAISVLLVHVNAFGHSFGIGQSGVDIFFVISGFIIGTIGFGESQFRFFSKRITRIVPLYWTITGIMWLIALVPGISKIFDYSITDLIKSFLFIPYINGNGEIEPLLVPGWTLNYEMFFYGLFGMTLGTRKPITVAVTAIIALVVAGLVLAPTNPILKTYSSPIMLEFAAGLVLSQAVLVRGTWIGTGLLLTAAAWFSIVEASDIHMEHARVFWLGIPACAMVSGALALERAGRWPHLRPLVLLGDASYSLYLLHLIVISFVDRLMQIAHLPHFLHVPLVLGLGIGAALISYHFFEVPVSRLCRALLDAHTHLRRDDGRLCGPMRTAEREAREVRKLKTRIQVDQRAKRILDVFISLTLIILTSPCLLTIAVAIKLQSSGPVLFVQQREGANGSVFWIYKFRSMFAQMTDANCATQCRNSDPRVTAVGEFIRRHGLDELPQLFNVLMGQMSIVGPRPHALGTNIDGHLLHEISDLYNARYVVKPGITGWAQINGSRGTLRTADDLRDRISYDLYYIENWSIWLDLKIIASTPARLIKDDALL